MKAVLVTDVFQSLLMFAAVFAVAIAGTIQVYSFQYFLQNNLQEVVFQKFPLD